MKNEINLEKTFERAKAIFKTISKVNHIEVDTTSNTVELFLSADYGLLITREGYDKIANIVEQSTLVLPTLESAFTHDVSGFDYWVNTMEEDNRITFTIEFKEPTFNEELWLVANYIGIYLDTFDKIKAQYPSNNYIIEKIISDPGTSSFIDVFSGWSEVYILNESFHVGSSVPSLVLINEDETKLFSFQDLVDTLVNSFKANYRVYLDVLEEKYGVKGDSVKDVTGDSLVKFVEGFIKSMTLDFNSNNILIEWDEYFY